MQRAEPTHSEEIFRRDSLLIVEVNDIGARLASPLGSPASVSRFEIMPGTKAREVVAKEDSSKADPRQPIAE